MSCVNGFNQEEREREKEERKEEMKESADETVFIVEGGEKQIRTRKKHTKYRETTGT